MLHRGSVFHFAGEMRVYVRTGNGRCKYLDKCFVSSDNLKVRIIRDNGPYWDVRITSPNGFESVWFKPRNKYSMRCLVEKDTLERYRTE